MLDVHNQTCQAPLPNITTCIATHDCDNGEDFTP